MTLFSRSDSENKNNHNSSADVTRTSLGRKLSNPAALVTDGKGTCSTLQNMQKEIAVGYIGYGMKTHKKTGSHVSRKKQART